MSRLKTTLLSLAAIASVATAAAPASAALVTYTGLDVGQAAPIGPNSAAAQAAYLAAAGPVTKIDFESAVPAGVSISGGSITTSSSCGFALCGGNTTPSGAQYLSLSGGTSTFTFSTPIQTFGAYFTGVQVIESFTFSDGSVQEVMIPNGGLSSGGMSFAGMTDFGKSILSVTINTTNGTDPCLCSDIMGVDDVFFGGGSVPEPSTWALMLLGFGGVGLAVRRRARGAALQSA
jgi:hypothetical protein